MNHPRQASYWPALWARAALGPMTAEEIGEILGRYGPDAVTALRGITSVRVEIAGEVPRADGRRPKKLYTVTDLRTAGL